MDNPFVAKEGILNSIDSDKVSHLTDNRIIGVTPCFYCGARSKYRAKSGNVYCTQEHEQIKENE